MIEREVPISQALLEKVLSNVTPDAVLVGGQALAIWVSHYNIDITTGPLVGAISDDADFLGGRNDVASIAQGVSGTPEYPPQRAITALVGQVKIHVAPAEFVNIDVIDKVVGIAADVVRRRASEAVLGATKFYVMHPLDVLLSRVENLAQLISKQNTEGIEQTRLATFVAREYIAELAKDLAGSRKALNAIEQVISISKSSAGKKASQEFGISFFTAIPKYAIENPSFHSIRWPRICQELSEAAGKSVDINTEASRSSLQAFLQSTRYSVDPLKANARYIGAVLWTDGIQAVQSLGHSQVVIHNVENWQNKPNVNNKSRTINYKDGVPALQPTPDHDRSSSFSP